MATPSYEYPDGPSRLPLPSAQDTALALLARADTHEAVASSLADKAGRLDPGGTAPVFRILWRMVRVHRIRAMLLRGQAACLEGSGPGAGNA